MTSRIIQVLKKGGVVVMPTDTLYGILGSAFSKKAVERIYRIKGRDAKKPFIVLISRISDIKKFGVGKIQEELKMFWPGRITIILPCKSTEFKYIHRGLNSIAFRIPNDKKLMALLRKTGPLVAPSANPEGKPPAQNIKEAKKYFGEKIDLYVNGPTKGGQPSTVIKWQKEKWHFVREGVIPLDKIDKLF